MGVSAGLAGLAASGLFGGLQTVEKPELPTVAVGEANNGRPWNVTVTGSRLVGELPGLSLTDGNRWLAVLATVEITADESQRDLKEILKVSGVEGLVDEEPKDGKPEYVLVLRDSSQPDYLNPGIPEKLAFLWQQSGTAPVPTSMLVEIWGKTHRVDSIAKTMEWLDPESRAEVKVPVEDRRGQ
jgi:hypothetical protein